MARRWPLHNEVIEAFLAAHARPDLCGLGVIEGEVFDQGGYTYLARDVPIFVSGYRALMFRPEERRVPFRTEVDAAPVGRLRNIQVRRWLLIPNNLIISWLRRRTGSRITSRSACFPGGGKAATGDRPTTCLYRRPGDCG